MKQTNFKSIVHRALCIVHSALNSALSIQHSALRLALLFVLMLGVGNAWGAGSYSLTTSSFTPATNNYATSEATLTGSNSSSWKVKGYGIVKETSLSIGKGSANYLKTPTCPENITSIEVNWSGNASYYLALKTTDGTELEAKQNSSSASSYTFKVSGSYTQLQLVGRRSSGSDNAEAKIYSVTVNYGSTKTIKSLAASGTPDKISYYAGDSFDPTGLTVTATYDDDSQEDVTKDVEWTPDPLTKGTTSVTGTLSDKNVVVNGITVVDPILVVLDPTDNKPFTATSASSTVSTTELNGITYENKGGYIFTKNSVSYLSLSKSTDNYLCNNTAFCGNIEKIVVDYNSGGTSHISMYQGTTAKPTATAVTADKDATSGEVTYTFNGNSPYFNIKIAATTNYVNINSIKIYLKPCVQATTLSFNLNGGTGTKPADVTSFPTTLPETTSFTKTGYTPNGWNTKAEGGGTHYDDKANFLEPTESVELFVEWKANKYNVIFNKDNDNAIGTMSNQEFAYNSTANLSANQYALVGHDFAGWATESKGSKAYDDKASYTMTATADVNLYALWTPKSYTITYKDKDNAAFSGTSWKSTQPTTHTYGTATTLVEPIKANYTFNGWFTASDCSGSAITELGATAFTDDITLYAKWTENAKYTITFVDEVQGTDCTSHNMTNAYVGTQIVFPQLADVDPSQIATECEKLHYHFVGWVEDGTAPVQDPSNVIAAGTTSINVTKTVTYKAVWAKEKAE